MKGQLLTELREALAVLVVPAADRKLGVAESLERIERLEERLGDAIEPRLKHYLTQRSYQKALLFLEGREAENERGNCGGKA